MNIKFLSQRGHCKCDRLCYYRHSKNGEVVYICDECGQIYRLERPIICKKCKKPVFDAVENGVCANCELKPE